MALHTRRKKLIFWMKFSSHGTYIRPKSVVEMATIPVVVWRERNWRMHNPKTNRMKKLLSKSLTRDGRAADPNRRRYQQNVAASRSTPPKMPPSRNIACPNLPTIP